MSAPFQYALLRAVPRIDRDEAVNIGVLLYCQDRRFLGCAVVIDADRVRALDPSADLDSIAAAADAVRDFCRDASAAARELPPGARFGWLTSPRSTVVQPGPVHAGLTADPAAELERLTDRLVR